MKDPRRILGGDDPLGRVLRDAWNAEQPSVAARERALALTPALAATTTVTRTGARVTLLGKAAATALGLCAICAAIAGWPRAAPAPPNVRAPTTTEPVAPIPVASPVSESVEALPSAPRPSAPSPRARPAAPSDLGEQVALIDGARRELAAGHAAAALRGLDMYTARFPHGAFGEEATVLRVQGLLATGDAAAARRAAARLLETRAGSPQAERVRVMLERAP